MTYTTRGISPNVSAGAKFIVLQDAAKEIQLLLLIVSTNCYSQPAIAGQCANR